MRRALARLALVSTATLVAVGWSTAAVAMPTMIRLGYSNCSACHISPQGGGPLNEYGRAIDEAQSLRSGEYRPSGNELIRKLSANGRILQDLRAVFAGQRAWTTGRAASNVFRPRMMYRNVTTLGNGFHASGTVTFESAYAPRPSLSYDPPAGTGAVAVNTALLHYRAAPGVEFAGGVDQLPTGINIPDLGAFAKSRNRLGYYDMPAQVKAFIGGKRYQVMPFAYAPGWRDAEGDGETGGGTLAEVDLLGKGTTVVGVSLLRGSATRGGRQMAGAYTRLGFGRWGILAEHQVTDRSRLEPVAVDFRQTASYAQVFFAVREWLVASAIGERLRVASPFVEKLDAGKFEVAMRLTNQAAVGISVRAQHNAVSRAWSPSVAVQVAVKSPQ